MNLTKHRAKIAKLRKEFHTANCDNELLADELLDILSDIVFERTPSKADRAGIARVLDMLESNWRLTIDGRDYQMSWHYKGAK